MLVSTSDELFKVIENVFSGDVNVSNPVVEYATTPTLYNLTLALANTEYSQALPAGTKKFTCKARGGQIKLCFTSGQSGTTYILLNDGQAYYEDNLKANITIYAQSPTAGTILEIVAWT